MAGGFYSQADHLRTPEAIIVWQRDGKVLRHDIPRDTFDPDVISKFVVKLIVEGVDHKFIRIYRDDGPPHIG